MARYKIHRDFSNISSYTNEVLKITLYREIVELKEKDVKRKLKKEDLTRPRQSAFLIIIEFLIKQRLHI